MKRIITLILAALMICAIFASCAGQEAPKTLPKTEPKTTEAPATTATPPTSTVPPTSTEAVAPPATGGINWDRVYYNENFREGFFLENYLPYSEYKEEFEEWKKDFVMFGKMGGREDFEYNSYTMITELGLPREQVEEWAYDWFAENYDVNSYAFEDRGPLSKEAFDLIYSEDKAGYYQLMVSPFAIAIGEYVINSRWLDEHSVEDYKEVGLSYEMLSQFFESSAYFINLEQRESVGAKIEKLKEA